MRISYSEVAKGDLSWFRIYYRSVFPEGGETASWKYLIAIRNPREHPRMSRPTEAPGVRELPIAGTPFSILYTIIGTTIEVLRAWDNRADPEARGFNEEQMEFA